MSRKFVDNRRIKFVMLKALHEFFFLQGLTLNRIYIRVHVVNKGIEINFKKNKF